MYASPYLHDDFAGGLEDTIVHLLLSLALRMYSMLPAPLTYIDTHAAAGAYRTNQLKTYRNEMVRRSSLVLLRSRVRHPLLRSFQAALRQMNHSATRMSIYPGSPGLAQFVLPSQTTFILSEKNQKIYKRLARWADGRKMISVFNEDGFDLAERFLRGSSERSKFFLYVDPAYETPSGRSSDSDVIRRLFRNIGSVPKNVAVGVTYPMSTTEDLALFKILFRELKQLRCNRIAYAHLSFLSKRFVLRGAGLLLINGPLGFDRTAKCSLSELSATLQLRGARCSTGSCVRT